MRKDTYTQFFHGFRQNISPFLLIDKYNNWWLNSFVKDFHQLLSFFCLCQHVHNLLDSFLRFACRSYVYNRRSPQIGSRQPFHRWGHSSCEHHRLQCNKVQITNLSQSRSWARSNRATLEHYH